MAGRLVGVQGSMVGQSVPLGAETSLGREPGNAVVLNDQTVGRRHAVIRQSGVGYLIEDLGSTNGTFVNEQRISVATALKSGDSIRLGGQVLRFEEALVPPPKVEVSRGEAAAVAGPKPVENPGLFRNAKPDFAAGCLDINLEGCFRWILIAIIVLFVLTVVALVLGLLSGGLGGLAGLAGGAGGGISGGSGGAGGGAGAPAGDGDDDGQQQTAHGGPVRVIDVKVDYGRRSGYTAVVPIVLVTWQNVGSNPISQVRVKVTGYDAQDQKVGVIENATLYSGPAVQPGEQHQDTLQQGGIVAAPGPANKLKQAPKRATVDVIDVR